MWGVRIARLNLAITNAERYQVLAGYHHDIFSAIEQRQLQRQPPILHANM
jgi:hypothetical protein